MAILVSLSTTGAHKPSALSRTLLHKEKEVETRTKLTQLSGNYWVRRLKDNKTHFLSNDT